jgi:succinate dehydrogenase / fumarate reductase cytochrome b subunit|tara:strand:- start:441 stop:815 length:375 start_codon:yes stop_codon:yes gene_type:complete
VKDNRPKNIDFSTLNLPLPAIISILFRISGVFIFLGVAALLYLFDLSLQSETGFARVLELLTSPLVKLIVWAIVAGLLYHLIAGLKHLLMDAGIGETTQGALFAARAMIVLFVSAAGLAGVWIW